MKKSGFLLIECSIALLLLACLMGSYAWYLWQSMALQSKMEIHLNHTTAMSTAIEELYAGGRNNSCILTPIVLPSMEGPWAPMVSNATLGYSLMQVHAPVSKTDERAICCRWYAGIYR